MLYKLAGAETTKVARQDWRFAMTSSSANLVWFLHLEKPKKSKN
jgi:arginine exporter protein ArgO